MGARSAAAIQLLINASATGTGQAWQGGRSSLFVTGTLATTTKFQILAQDNVTWVDVATISAVGLTSYDLPAGQYRMSLSGGSPAVYATLSEVPYT